MSCSWGVVEASWPFATAAAPFVNIARLLAVVLRRGTGFPLGSDFLGTDGGMTSTLLGWSGEGERVERRVEVRLERGGACREGRTGDTEELIKYVVKQISRRGVANQPNANPSRRERVQVARQIYRSGRF
jgi:hypothetical protein